MVPAATRLSLVLSVVQDMLALRVPADTDGAVISSGGLVNRPVGVLLTMLDSAPQLLALSQATTL